MAHILHSAQVTEAGHQYGTPPPQVVSEIKHIQIFGTAFTYHCFVLLLCGCLERHSRELKLKTL